MATIVLFMAHSYTLLGLVICLAMAPFPGPAVGAMLNAKWPTEREYAGKRLLSGIPPSYRHSSGNPVGSAIKFGIDGKHNQFGAGFDAPAESYRYRVPASKAGTTSGSTGMGASAASHLIASNRPQSSGPLSYSPGSKEFDALQQVLSGNGPQVQPPPQWTITAPLS